MLLFTINVTENIENNNFHLHFSEILKYAHCKEDFKNHTNVR